MVTELLKIFFCVRRARVRKISSLAFYPTFTWDQKNPPMSKAIVTSFICPLCLLFAWSEADGGTTDAQKQRSPNNQNVNGTLQKMIVENGSVTLNLDLNGLNGSNALITRPVTLQFAATTNSFFPILVFNDQLRGPDMGSIALVAQAQPTPLLPAALAAS